MLIYCKKIFQQHEGCDKSHHLLTATERNGIGKMTEVIEAQ